jgi:hypothetical protein
MFGNDSAGYLLVVGLYEYARFHLLASPLLDWPAPPQRAAQITSGDALAHAPAWVGV